ncbi:MAG TPA: SDR family NAD(P)-dependent oxidoreductase [Steroidobacteraceae bacterium]|jgi:WW domain-containing oxidoreductase
MAPSIPFGARSTADQVLAGIDLTRKRMVVIGCHGDIGLETMKALVANGAHVIGLAPALEDARSACSAAGTSSTPIACDLADFASIDSAADSICGLPGPLDAIIATTERVDSPVPTRHHGGKLQHIVEYIGHFALINRLTDRVRSNSGRIVMVSSDVSHAPTEAVTFDNLDDPPVYEPLVYGQAQSANAIYAKELSRRLAPRGVSVNSWDPGSSRGAGLNDRRGWAQRLIDPVARLFMRSAAQRAATAALLAASPLVAGLSGAYWSNCRITRDNPLLADEILAKRFWETSEQIVTAIRAAPQIAPQAAAGNSAVRA